jgi:hypothetical protein
VSFSFFLCFSAFVEPNLLTMPQRTESTNESTDHH